MMYSLKSSNGDTARFDCYDNCVYTKDDDDADKEFCFKTGPLDTKCETEDESTATQENKIKLIVRNSVDNLPVTNAKVTLYFNSSTPLYTDSRVDSSLGTIEFDIPSNGIYSGNVTADGFINSNFELNVNCTALVCTSSLLVALSPFIESNDTVVSESVRVIMTWGEKPRDLDLWVVSYDVRNGSTCATWYANKNNCTEKNLDVDETDGGLNGPETITLTNPSVNKDYVYAIAIDDYSQSEDFITSGAKVQVVNAVKTEEHTLPASVTEPSEQQFYFFGCVSVTEDGNFNFEKAPEGTFFKGKKVNSARNEEDIAKQENRQSTGYVMEENNWISIMQTHCSIPATTTT